MIANYVQVVTRRSDAAVSDTTVLEFSSGLNGRPILRPANKDEHLIDGGTRVRIKLTHNPHKKGGMLYASYEEKELSLKDVCRQICPSVDVDIYVVENGANEKVINANDWQNMDGVELLKRMDIWGDRHVSDEIVIDLRKRAAPNLRLLKDSNGEIFGRACISIGNAIFSDHMDFDLRGVVTVGGLKACGLSGIIGILLGRPTRSSRDAAKPIVPGDVLKYWAEEQASLVPQLWKNPKEQSECAEYIHMCGGSTKKLPITIHKGKWLSSEDIAEMVNPPETAILVDHYVIDRFLKILSSYVLVDTLFVTGASGIPGLLQSREIHGGWPGERKDPFILGTMAGVVIEALSVAWGVTLDDVLSVNELKREEEVTIAKEGDREIKVNAVKIIRPQ